ncbi:uncharacterized protein C8Q71DRAFT_891794 [Rhodofomes roseus]|uniref:Uncharacterized protein n=1 Tax=Rhodofomes roseus TaxID=34475 RepID=A0ABQ8JXI2_9APHY|nr:uncharacterized protein C8Q71DRAFT_891782 [Rhodofomes roseus]XP_047772459.1 uncharacterized protein C8Q71DRAFT_891794 [Rhodofomes roseus]KAH9828812.1 hypothetical protein C8Q71DRAFT_891782 [Rhodofomes roseus]KAH9828818.1 hypothetical protein C8Q71DRAFT_891794 [Rhodofomes roseus]
MSNDVAQVASSSPKDEEPPARTLSPRSHGRVVVRAHHEREAQAAAAAWRAHRARYSAERWPAAQAAPTRSSGGPARVSPTRRGVETAGVRDGTAEVSTSTHAPSGPSPSPSSQRVRPARPLSHDPHVLVERARRPPPSPAPPAHRERAPPADSHPPSRQGDTLAPAECIPRRPVSPSSSDALLRSRRPVAISSPSYCLAPASTPHARPLSLAAPTPWHPPSRALSPQSRARALVHRHQEREAQAAKQAEGSPIRSSGGLAHASAKGREVESTGGREDTPAPAHSLSCNTLSPVERAHHRSVPPPLSSALAPTSRQGVDRPARQAPHWHANGAHGAHVPPIGAPSDVRTSPDSARPAAASRPGPSTTCEMSSSGDPRRDGCRAARDHRAPGSLSSPASSTHADGPARANALILDASDPPSPRKPASASVLLPRHSPDSRPPSRPFEQVALASVEHDHRRLASPSSGVPAPAPRERNGPPMCQAPLPHVVGTLGKHAPPTVAPFDARASPDTARPAAASRPSLLTARKTSSSDNLRDGCRAVRDHRSPGSLPSSASSCRPVLVSTPRLSHPPDSLASIPPSCKEEPDLAGLDEELRRRIWQVRARSRLVTEDSPESAAIAEEEAALRREIWQARARARLAPRLV